MTFFTSLKADIMKLKKKSQTEKINVRIKKINARIVLKSNTLVALINKVKNGPKGK